MIKHMWILAIGIIALLPFKSLSFLPAIILVVLGLIKICKNWQAHFNNDKERHFVLLSACLIVPMFASIPDSIVVSESIRKSASFLLYVFLGIAVIQLFDKRVIFDRFLLLLGIVISVWLFDATLQYLSGKNILGYPYQSGRLTGIFYPDQRIGIVLAIFSALYLEFLRKYVKYHVIAVLLTFLLIVIVILGGSRSSWFMLMFTFCLYTIYIAKLGVFSKEGIKHYVMPSLLILFSVIMLFVSSPGFFQKGEAFLSGKFVEITNFIERTENLNESNNALVARITHWEAALRATVQNPLNGVGVRGFRNLDENALRASTSTFISDSISLSTHPHQLLLEILVETGMIGLVGYFIFWVLMLGTIYKLMKCNEFAHGFVWYIPLIIAIFPLNMHKSFYGGFSSMIIWLLLPLAVAAGSVYSRNRIFRHSI